MNVLDIQTKIAKRVLLSPEETPYNYARNIDIVLIFSLMQGPLWKIYERSNFIRNFENMLFIKI